MAITRYENMAKFMPAMYRIGNNQMITEIIKAWCQSDEEVAINIQETKNQLFVRLASNNYLDYLGSNVGVGRPTLVPVTDSQYKEYILAAGYRPKTVRKLIYEILDIFWGEHRSRSKVESTGFETFNFTGGPFYLALNVDNEPVKNIKFEASDFDNPAAATAQEVCDKINAIYGSKVVAETFVDSVLSRTYVRIYTKTPGLGGSVQITAYIDPTTGLPAPGSDANAILAFPTTKQQTQEVTVVELYPNHIILKIPSYVQINASLKGSHYFHPDATIIDPRPAPIDTANPFWPGNFLYDYNDVDVTYTHTIGYNPTQVTCVTTADIPVGAVINQIGVDNNTQFPNSVGYIMFNYGHGDMEKVKYIGRVSTPDLLGIDPTYTFQREWLTGTTITLLEYPQSDPRTDGSDYPIYFIDTEVSRQLATQLVELIKAAGVILEFDIQETHYLYDGTDFSWFGVGGTGGGGGVAESWFQPPKMLDADEAAMVAAWGVAERGRIWYNETRDQLRGWSGSAVVTLG